VGGVRAPGSTTFEDLRASIMDVLMKLPHDTVVHPGHTDATTIGDEWESNAFVRLWRGLDEESDERCRVGDEEAVLVLFAPDYDGGHKAWVRWTETGRDDIVPGSAVERL
jgi:glyoxylase-like metal-dependent hydrolase (beta-lactamase superfamily II)